MARAPIVVKIRREGEAQAFPLPRYQTPASSGMDLTASQTVQIHPGHWQLVKTGLFLEIPEGFEGQVRPRSGLALKCGVTVLNAPGTIDSDYRGELCILLINHGPNPFPIEPGDRIAQLVIAPVVQVALEESDDLCTTERGSGGFGSTGTD